MQLSGSKVMLRPPHRSVSYDLSARFEHPRTPTHTHTQTQTHCLQEITLATRKYVFWINERAGTNVSGRRCKRWDRLCVLETISQRTVTKMGRFSGLDCAQLQNTKPPQSDEKCWWLVFFHLLWGYRVTQLCGNQMPSCVSTTLPRTVIIAGFN